MGLSFERICSSAPSFAIEVWTFFHLNVRFVPSHPAEIIIGKLLNQGGNNVTRVWVEQRSCDQQGRRKYRLKLRRKNNLSAELL